MTFEKKIIGGVVFFTALILIGGIDLFSGGQKEQVSISGEEVVAKNGLHWHPKLFIYVNGEKQEIPEGIGLEEEHEEIHTHEDAVDGVLHMEMEGMVTKDETKLGRFFTIWKKKFSSKQIFDFKNGTEGKVIMFVNKKENYEFENYHMKDKDMIDIRYE